MRPINLKNFVIGVVLLLIFVVLELFLAHQNLLRTDTAITLFLQRSIPRIFDVPLSLFSLLGSFEATGIILAIMGIAYWKKKKAIPYSFVLFGAILALELLGKFYVYHPGPPKSLFRYSLPFELPTAYVTTSYSFPSGHVSRTIYLSIIAFFLARILIKSKNMQATVMVLVVLLFLLMFISRIYLGEHWFSDVIGGTFLGGALGMLTLVYY